MFEVVAATTTDETFVTHVTLNLTLSLPHGTHLGDVQTLSNCKIHASLFLSSSGPHAMVQEAFLTTKDIFIFRRFCARQVDIYKCICNHSTNEYIEYYRSVVNALFSRFETILILYIRRLRT